MDYKNELIHFDNGLRFVFVKTQGFYTAKLKVLFCVGSEDEKAESGISHLLEHELFKGTTEYSQKELSEEFSKIASEPSASTSSEFTKFSATFPLPALERTAELFSKMIFDSVFDEKELELEKKVILEEIKMHADKPNHLVFDNLISTMFKGVGIGNRIGGNPELLKKVSRNDLFEYKSKRYCAKNCIIAVIGDYTLSEAKKIVEKYFYNNFEQLKISGTKTKVFSKKVDHKCHRIIVNRNISQANIMIGFPAPPCDSFEKIKMFLVNDILGGSMNSRLFTKLRNDLALCYNIYSSQISYANNGVLLIEFSTSNQNAKLAVESVLDELKRIKQNGVTDEEFEQSRYVALSDIRMKNDLPYIKMDTIAYTDKIYDRRAIEECIKTCTKEECLKIFNEYVDFDKMTISCVGKKQVSKKAD